MKKIIPVIIMFSLSSYSSAQILKQLIPDKTVVLTFDDATASQYSEVAPLLKQYGFNATFFICEFPPNFADTSKYMTWQQIKELDTMGFEIGNHTKTHAHVDKITKEQFVDQLEYIEKKCDSLGIEKPSSFAYPGYGIGKSAIDVLIAKGYCFSRAGGHRVYDPLTDYPLLLPSWATNADNKAQIMAAFAEAKNGKIVILTLHGVPDIEHPWVNTPPGLFKEYLQYLADNQFNVIAIRDLNGYIDIEKALNITPDFSKDLRN